MWLTGRAEDCERGDLTDTPTGEIVRKAADGDERAWTELVNRFGPMVLCVARRAGLNAADAADVQQETWLQLMRHAGRVRDPERIGAWLATTARRHSEKVAATSFRRSMPATPMETAGSADPATDDVETLVLRAHCEPALQRALGRLPDEYRRLLQLLTSDSTPSYADAATLMNLPVGSIGPMRQRGLRMLRRDLELQGRPGFSSPKTTTAPGVRNVYC